MTDTYQPYVTLLLHCDGANNSTTFTDTSYRGNTITASGNAKISTTQSKFGGSSAYFDGNGDYLQLNDSEYFNFGSGDFTFEVWIYPTALPSTGYYFSLISQRSTFTSGYSFSLELFPTGIPSLGISNSGSGQSGTYAYVSGTAVTANTWTHLAVTRASGTLRMFQNGVITGTNSNANFSIYNSTANIKIGAFDAPAWSNSYYTGYMDDLRITKGIARYTSGFTPPDAQFEYDSPTLYYTRLEDIRRYIFYEQGDVTGQILPSIIKVLPAIYDGGTYKITGTVTYNGSPARRKVRLFTLRDGRLIDETWSDASTGAYAFTQLKDQEYFVWSEDYLRVYDPVSHLAENAQG
jgi:hypothetical protein